MAEALPTCPRCGYDQSGVVATWEPAGACPLGGVCSECGLAFAWADIFRPDRERLLGFFEHADTTRRFVFWAIRTLGWTVRPWAFWRRVTVFTRPVLSRIVIWPFLLFAMTHGLGSLLACADRAIEIWNWRGGNAGWDFAVFATCWTSPFFHFESDAWWGGWSGRSVNVMWDPYGAARAMLALLVGWLSWPLLLLLLGDSLRAGKIRRIHVLRAAAYSLAWILFLEVLRAANAAIWLVIAATAALSGTDPSTDPWVYEAVSWLNALAGVGLLVWLPVWWWFAINRGFGLRHGWWVWGLFLIASGLAAVLAGLAAALLSQDFGA